MKRLLVLLVVSVVALTGCKKKDDNKSEADKIRHGEGDGKGTGGGDKKAVGTKDAKPGSGKKIDDAPEADPALVERGAYLSALGGCAMCHTALTAQGPDMSKMLGGGFEMEEKGPDGKPMVWRSLNITNHETGIKDWTDEEVMTAIREGKRKDGSMLAPIMPYMLYNRLTDDDAKALVAFLRSVPPVDNKVERALTPPEMSPPADKPKNEPIPTDEVGKGGYYASLMHCVMCHTPMTDKGPDMSKAFAGGFAMEMPASMAAMGTGTLYTPNITSDADTGIGKWTEEDLVKAVKTATKKDGSPIVGPMMFYTLGGWNQMTDGDATALAKFIKAVPAVKNKVPKSTFKPAAGGPPPGDAPPTPDGADGDKAESTDDKPDDTTGGKDAVKPADGATLPPKAGDKADP